MLEVVIWCFLGVLVILFVVTSYALLWEHATKEKKKDSFIEDYKKWGQMEVKRIIEADTKQKPLF